MPSDPRRPIEDRQPAAPPESPGRVALVLGGGGALGIAWMLGALGALVSETSWDPRLADLIVGTSAGALVGSLMLGRGRIWELSPEERHEMVADLLAGARFEAARPFQVRFPGSWPLARSGGHGDRAFHLSRLIAGLAPQGVISTAPISSLVQRLGPRGWPVRPPLAVVATDYRTGERVAFGRPGAPAAALPDAVAASCAIPAVYRPVDIGGRLYIDGGVSSACDLDLALACRPHLVVYLNALSSPASARGGRAGRWLRVRLHDHVMRKVRGLEASGAQVALLEPGEDSLRLIGWNPMRRRDAREVGTTAASETTRRLREPDVRRKLVVLDLVAWRVAPDAKAAP